MDLYPAIDVRAGRVVRMRRDDPHAQVVYAHDPIALAERYAREGARWVHVVDLDRVFGFGEAGALLADLVRRVAAHVQAGGGVTTPATAGAVLDCGVRRVIVHAKAALAPGGLAAVAARCGGARLALALDAAHGLVDLGEGTAARPAAELAGEAAAAGIGTVVLTDLSREGRLGGADVAGATQLAREAAVDVIVSGGVGSLEELSALRDAGVAGVVVGRALLDGRFTLGEALACSSS